MAFPKPKPWQCSRQARHQKEDRQHCSGSMMTTATMRKGQGIVPSHSSLRQSCPVHPKCADIIHRVFTFTGRLMPWKKCGMMRGRTQFSCRMFLASFRPAMSSHRTPKLASRMSLHGHNTSCASRYNTSQMPYMMPKSLMSCAREQHYNLTLRC